MPSCYRIWDVWLNMWESSMIHQHTQSLIPMLLAVGNHEGDNFFFVAAVTTKKTDRKFLDILKSTAFMLSIVVTLYFFVH